MIKHGRQEPAWLQDAMVQLAAQREAEKQRKQQASDKVTLELARERIRNHQGESA